MAAQTAKRVVKSHYADTIELGATAATYYQGSLICFDTSVGRVVKGAVSTTLIPVGVAAEDKVIATNLDPLLVKRFAADTFYWFANLAAAPVLAANVGGLCYIADDQSVRVDDATNTCSVAGRVIRLDTVKGVLVAVRNLTSANLTGLDA